MSTVAISATELEFSSYLRSRDGLRFVVTDVGSGRASEFLGLGHSFRGYLLADFDERREVLTIERDGKRAELSLKESRIRSGDGRPGDTVELTIMVTPNGALASGTGEPLTIADFEIRGRSLVEGSRKLHVMLVVPRMPGRDGKPVIDALHTVLASLKKVSPKGASLELVNVDADLIVVRNK